LLHTLPLLVWWQAGMPAGLAALAGLHLCLVAVTLCPRASVFGSVPRTFPARGRQICLTIDDGPGADTPALLDLLDAHQARAVFFLIGERAAAHPDLVRAIIARGHCAGNHTATHPAHWFWSYGPQRQRLEIASCSAALTEITGTPPQWFRAPAGFRNPFTGAVVRECGLRGMGWLARGFDSRDARIPRILNRLRRGFHPGGILLVHQGHPHSVALLTALLEALRADGWRVVLPPPA